METKMLHFEVRKHDHHKAGFSCVQIAHVSFLCRGVSAVFFAAFTKTRFFEILDRCVDEAVRGYYQLAH